MEGMKYNVGMEAGGGQVRVTSRGRMVYVASVVCSVCSHEFVVVLPGFDPPSPDTWFLTGCPKDATRLRFRAVSACVDDDALLTHPLTRFAQGLPKDEADNCLVEGVAFPE